MNDCGMFWYDDSPEPLAEKVRRAAEFYRAKYGAAANACFVHPAELAPTYAPITVGMIRVRPRRQVTKGHLWLGIEGAAR